MRSIFRNDTKKKHIFPLLVLYHKRGRPPGELNEKIYPTIIVFYSFDAFFELRAYTMRICQLDNWLLTGFGKLEFALNLGSLFLRRFKRSYNVEMN